MSKPTYTLGAPVRKVSGYSFDGFIVAVFQNSIGEWRYVVEHQILVGMLHIFNENQLEPRDPKLPIAGMTGQVAHELKHYKAAYEVLVAQAPPRIRALEQENEILKAKVRTLEASRKELRRLLDDVSVELEADDE